MKLPEHLKSFIHHTHEEAHRCTGVGRTLASARVAGGGDENRMHLFTYFCVEAVALKK